MKSKLGAGGADGLKAPNLQKLVEFDEVYTRCYLIRDRMLNVERGKFHD